MLDFYRWQDFFNPLLYRLSYRARRSTITDDQTQPLPEGPLKPNPQAVRLPRERSTPSCLSLRYRWVRSRPVRSATRVMEPPSLARWNSK